MWLLREIFLAAIILIIIGALNASGITGTWNWIIGFVIFVGVTAYFDRKPTSG